MTEYVGHLVRRKNLVEKFRKARPLCPEHLIPMVTYSTHESVRYLKCPMEDCNCTQCQTR